jgi:hypothetical protein
MVLHLQEQLPTYKQPMISTIEDTYCLQAKSIKNSSDNPNVLVLWFSSLAIDTKYIYK